MTPAGARRVAVLRREWLRPSETFVRDHVAALQRWTPVTGAYLRVPRTVSEPDCRVATGSRPAEFAWRYGPRRPWQRRLARQLAEREVAAMHVHFGVDALDLLPVRELLGVPLVVTFHGYDASATGRANMRDYFARIGEVFAAADRLVAVSDFVAGRLRELAAPGEKIRTVVNGVDVERFAGTRLPPGAAEPPSVLFVGRLVEKKGVADLLDAAASLPAPSRARIDVVGDGPLAEPLARTAAARGLDVRFHAFAGHDAIAAMMRRATLVCVPSRQAADGDSEGLPTVAVEAAAAGVPVVATRHAGLPEIVVDGETGLLAPEGDVAGLAAQMERVLGDPALAAALGAAARRRATARFDIRRQARVLEQLYDEAVAEHTAPR